MVYYSEIKTVNVSSAKKEVSVYPNPAKDIININLFNFETGQIYVEIFSTLGEKIKEIHLEGENQHTISLDFLPQGVYIFKVISSDKEQNFKIIKE